MPRGRTQHPTPDLFSEASAPEPANQVSSPKAAVDMAASLRRYLAPKDLANAPKRLDDGELASLLAAALDEAKRRGKLPPSLAASASDDPTPRGSRKRNESSKVRPTHVAGSLADKRPSERRSCGLQGRYSAPSNCAGVRDLTIRSAEGAGLRRMAARKGKVRLRHSPMGSIFRQGDSG
jgi:hypothetical protein